MPPETTGAGRRIRRSDGRPSICLSMIVKNEAAVIERCLTAILPYLDAWVVVDTGSTDGTQAMVRRLLASLPGELIERPWIDFSTNRNQALDASRMRADYSFSIDADEELIPARGFVMPALTAAGYRVVHRSKGSDVAYELPKIVRSDLPWRYQGVVHEGLVCPLPHAVETIEGLAIVSHFDSARNQASAAVKYGRDAELLERALRDDPENARYRFYLAQSYKDAGALAKATEAYLARAEMGGWDEEVFCSRFQAGALLLLQGQIAEGTHLLLRAFELRPTRAESLHALASHHRRRGEWNLAYVFAARASDIPRPPDILFVDEAVYRWRCWDERSIAAYYVGRFQESFDIANRLLAGDLPPPDRKRIDGNRAFAAGQLAKVS